MQLLNKGTTVGADKLSEQHPLTLEFLTRYGVMRFHSCFRNEPKMAIVIGTPQDVPTMLYFVEPTEHPKAAIEVLAKYFNAALQNLTIGEVVNIFQPNGSNAVSVMLRIVDNGLENQYLQVLGQDPYSGLSKIEIPKHKPATMVVVDPAVA